jgi:tight adherence protein B
MRPRCLAPLVVVAAIAPLCVIALARQQPTFRVGIDLVTVDVSVTRNVEPVSGLEAENFTVFDNGVKQKLERVIQEQVPLEAFLVLDMSGSVAGPELEQLKAAASAFVSGLTSADKVALVTFAEKATIAQALTTDLDAFARALAAVEARGNTAIYDAAHLAITLRKRGDTRGVAVVFTDGMDNASTMSAKAVVEAAERSDLVVYGVTVSPTRSEPAFGLPDLRGQFQVGFLRSLADTTGGRVFNAAWGPRLKDVFGLILDDIRARYLLTYYPDKVAAGWHKLQVKLNGVKGDVLARRGYYAAPARER